MHFNDGNTPTNKVDPEMREQVRRDFIAGESRAKLVISYGVSDTTIWRMCKGLQRGQPERLSVLEISNLMMGWHCPSTH